MAKWLSDPAAPAWVQALGSILAILVAVFVPWFQRRNTIRDALSDHKRQDIQHLQLLVAGLREEISATIDAADRRLTAINATFEQLREAKRLGVQITQSALDDAGSLSLTDAIIYKALASELGRLPPELIQQIVAFYSLTLDIVRVAGAAPTAIEAYKAILPSLPRVKTHGGIVVGMLDKLAKEKFQVTANLRLAPEEIRQIAANAGYPLDDILRERGIVLPG